MRYSTLPSLVKTAKAAAVIPNHPVLEIRFLSADINVNGAYPPSSSNDTELMDGVVDGRIVKQARGVSTQT
jgi:hypothetical protein